MKPSRIQSLVDRLLARDHCYRPLALLAACMRLDGPRQEQWQKGELAFLEDALVGNRARSLDLLKSAADWARTLGLRAELEVQEPGNLRFFRNANDDHLARTVWHRRTTTAQTDLFFDNRFAVARSGLARALLDDDAEVAEAHLSEMARAEPGNDVQADAEHLVGALAWTRQPVKDPAGLLTAMDQELSPRARRFLGPSDSKLYLARFWRYLIAGLNPSSFDPSRPDLHPSALAARFEDWPAVISAVEAVDDAHAHAPLLQWLATAGLKAQRRDIGLTALCQLCWRHAEAAEQWLEMGDDDELNGRIAMFWDLDPPLPIELFPAWLTMRGYPLPEIDPAEWPPGDSAETVAHIRALRLDPASLSEREWLQTHQPELFARWLDGGPRG
jgi:hypothetical protein